MYEKRLLELRERSYKLGMRNDPRKPVSYWKEEDILFRRRVRAFVAIFRTRGCSWARSSGGCTMCGYSNDVYPKGPSEDDLLKQLEEILEKYSGEEYVKIFTSGSFLDESEISRKIGEKIIGSFSGAEVVSIESRPEYINEKSISWVKKVCRKIGAELEVSIGLESSNQHILLRYIHKGFGIEEYVRAARILHSKAAHLKTYVLLKPPFLSEAIALRDCINSGCFAANFSEKVSINPVVVQRNTLVEDLWKKGLYDPPWCFTLLEALKGIKEEKPEVDVVSSPMKKYSKRGLRGCKNCLEECLRRIEQFSLSQELKILEFEPDCRCVENWKEEIALGEKVPFLF